MKNQVVYRIVKKREIQQDLAKIFVGVDSTLESTRVNSHELDNWWDPILNKSEKTLHDQLENE